MSRSAPHNGPFSDALSSLLLSAAALTAIGCAQQPQIGGPGSPLREARIDAVLPPAQSGPDARLHFEYPEYARRDRDLGLRRDRAGTRHHYR